MEVPKQTMLKYCWRWVIKLNLNIFVFEYIWFTKNKSHFTLFIKKAETNTESTQSKTKNK